MEAVWKSDLHTQYSDGKLFYRASIVKAKESDKSQSSLELMRPKELTPVKVQLFNEGGFKVQEIPVKFVATEFRATSKTGKSKVPTAYEANDSIVKPQDIPADALTWKLDFSAVELPRNFDPIRIVESDGMLASLQTDWRDGNLYFTLDLKSTKPGSKKFATICEGKPVSAATVTIRCVNSTNHTVWSRQIPIQKMTTIVNSKNFPIALQFQDSEPVPNQVYNSITSWNLAHPDLDKLVPLELKVWRWKQTHTE